MCIAVYKPMGVEFPNKKRLKACFHNNPDGAGFMVATGKTVEIHKGYMGFTEFWKSLRSVRAKYGEKSAYVMHFRISTQGGIRKDACHPFPLSREMKDLRALDTKCDIGIAHNGIISLTSEYGKVDYSDTMKFITDYLSLIIKDGKYYKDEDTLALVTKLCGSRLAILDKHGHCELIGSGWSVVDGVWYSNESYHERKVKTSYFPTLDSWTDGVPSWWDSYDEDSVDYEYYDMYLKPDGLYDFPEAECPLSEVGDPTYCDLCVKYMKCYNGENEVRDE